jgi:Mpv17 / PMP22 family
MFRLLLLVAMLCSSSPESRVATNFVTLLPPGAGIFVNIAVITARSSPAMSSTTISTTARHPLVFLQRHTYLPSRGPIIRDTDYARLQLEETRPVIEEVALLCHNDTCQDGTALPAYHHQDAPSSDVEHANDESTIKIETPLMFVLLASIVLSLRRCTRTQEGQHSNVASLLRRSLSLLANVNMVSLLAVALFAALAEDFWNHISTATSFAAWSTLGESYMGYLESHPIATKSLSAGVIAMIGDYCAQWIDFALQGDHRLALSLEHTSNNISVHQYCGGERTIPSAAHPSHVEPSPSVLSIYGRYRSRRGFAVLADGIFITGPLMHLGFEIFERWMPIAGTQDDPAAANIAAVVHVIADTLILDSFFVAFCFVSTGLMEGMPRDKLWLQFKTDCLSSLVASWATSVALCPIQFCFFRYLPLQLRVLSVNSIDLVWGAVQSFMSHRNRHH